MSENQTEKEISKPQPRWWKPYWITLFIATIIVGITVPIFMQFPFEKAVTYGLNRIMYILLGTFIGGVFWIVSAFFLSRIFTQGFSEDAAIIVSLAVCFGFGALLGDLIGRARHYKGPERYQP